MSSLPVLYIAPLKVFLAELPKLVTNSVSVSISGESTPPTIAELRRITHRAAWRPYKSEVETLVICRVEAMHLAAQSSLLKFLEEPPDWVELLLQAATEEVLPTIRSRVAIRALAGEVSGESLASLLTLSSSERLKKVEGLSEEPAALLQSWLSELDQDFPAATRYELASLIVRLLPLLHGGANKKLVLEYLMFSLPRTNEKLKSKIENRF